MSADMSIFYSFTMATCWDNNERVKGQINNISKDKWLHEKLIILQKNISPDVSINNSIVTSVSYYYDSNRLLML